MPESAFFTDDRTPVAGDQQRWRRLGTAASLVIALMFCIAVAYGNLGSVRPSGVTAPEAVIAAAEAANRWIDAPEATLVSRGLFSYRVTFVGKDRNGSPAFVECDVLPSGEVRAAELRIYRRDPRSWQRVSFGLAILGALACLVTMWRRRDLYAATTYRNRIGH